MKKKINEVTDYELDPQIKNSIETQYRTEIKRQIDRNKKEQKKERILTAIITTFIIVATCLLLLKDTKKTNKVIDNCISRGHNENYCYNKWA